MSAGDRRIAPAPRGSRPRAASAEPGDVRAAARTPTRRRPARTRAARISSTPRSNSSRLNGLAGATTARRSPGASARGLSITAKRAISSAIARCSSRPSACAQRAAAERPRRDRRGEEPLLRAPLPLERVLDARHAAGARPRPRGPAPRAPPPARRDRRCRSARRRSRPRSPAPPPSGTA